MRTKKVVLSGLLIRKASKAVVTYGATVTAIKQDLLAFSFIARSSNKNGDRELQDSAPFKKERMYPVYSCEWEIYVFLLTFLQKQN